MGQKVKQEVKRGPGRPPRTDNPTRLAVLVPGELRRWLRIRAAEEERDMGDIVTESLAAYRKRVKPMGR
jgi:hypothetical protein